MSLTAHQLKSLRYDLQELAQIDYTDVLNELLDHYAMLTEEQMANGMPFEEASKCSWEKLGSERGLQKIQNYYVNNNRKQLINRHFSILKSYARWPYALITLLIVLLTYQLMDLLSIRSTMLIASVTVLTPCLSLLYVFWAWGSQHDNTQKLAWNYLVRYTNLSFALINITTIYSNETRIVFTRFHPILGALTCVIFLLIAISLVQLARAYFQRKPAISNA